MKQSTRTTSREKVCTVKYLSTRNANNLQDYLKRNIQNFLCLVLIIDFIILVKRFFSFILIFFSVAEREEEEEMSKAGMSVNRRPKPKKAPRPKSQPPGVSAPGVQSSPSHSSQEDLVKQRKYLKPFGVRSSLPKPSLGCTTLRLNLVKQRTHLQPLWGDT